MQTIRFLSQYPGLKLIRRSAVEIFANGRMVPDPSQPEVSYQFDRGVLELFPGADLMEDQLDPETGALVSQDAIDWVRAQPANNNWFYEVEPVAPEASEILTRITGAAASGDVDALLALGDEEHNSWNRPEVLDVINDAIGRIQAVEGEKVA